MKNMGRQWIFLVMGVLVLVFLKTPLSFNYTPSLPTQGFYDALEQLESGSYVYLAVDYGPSSQAEILPAHRGMVYQLLKKDIKIVAASLWDSAPPLTDKVFDETHQLLLEQGIEKEYGVDYVNLGYKAGQDVVMVKVATSIPETFPKDYKGTPIGELPIMDGITNFEQFSLICTLSSGFPGVREWLQQVQQRFQVRLIASVTAVMSPDLYSFFHSGQIEGFLGGLVGVAEYESLINRPGEAMDAMTVQSLIHVYILVLILIGNYIYFFGKKQEKDKHVQS